jgi:alkanesulfonate monooxygenase SsuD/methylene tetrahydromethanopterin reductase-like flavin-dependent oxidoreductase (luciferase family)
LREPATTRAGRFYAAHEARMVPGCLQRPRSPFLIAATGPRGLSLAARFGQGWVTTGPSVRQLAAVRVPTPESTQAAVAAQVADLAEACASAGRDPDDLEKVLLTGFLPGDPPDSFDDFLDRAGRFAESGITELVVHWPVPDSPFAMDQALFERIITELPAQLPVTAGHRA